jgi:hypothetical protein
MVFGEVRRAVKAGLERHAQYNEHVHGEAVDPCMLIPEILRVFLDADREFQSRSRSVAPSNRAASPRRLRPTAAPRRWRGSNDYMPEPLTQTVSSARPTPPCQIMC